LALKIVLITSGQPSVNPRLVKEADVLSQNGYDVTVIYQYWNDWATASDEMLLAKKPWQAIRVGGTPKEDKITYWISRLFHKLSRIAGDKIGLKHGVAELAIGRCTFLLCREACKHPADIYIAHNLAALPAAIYAAKKRGVKCGFDAEDFHRNEVTDDPQNMDFKLKSFIEDKFLSKLDYFTAASPLIAEMYKCLYPSLTPVLINNVFPFNNQSTVSLNTQKELKLFWFSQTIGKHRGIEDVIQALNILKNKNIELHLLGEIKKETVDSFDNLISSTEVKLIYHNPISPDDISTFSSQFDIGLATEVSYPKNRQLCLTNKIFSYMISGLAIIASDTLAQKQLLNSHPTIGKVYSSGSADQLAAYIQELFENRALLNEYKQNSYILAKEKYNWEKESTKVLYVVKDTIKA